MKHLRQNGAGVWILYAITAAVIATVLLLGLWPLRFHPANDVDWIAARDGISFGQHGSVVSSGAIRIPADYHAGPCSLELWLQPALGSASTSILTFSGPSNPRQFQLTQSLEDLFVIQDRSDSQGRLVSKHIAISPLFEKDRSVFVSISGNSRGTAVYIDGQLRRLSSEVRLTCESLAGNLLLANSPNQYSPWQGRIFQLAIYRGTLDAATVFRHYRALTSAETPGSASNASAFALYSFSERAGQFIHDQTHTQPVLAIPPYYSVLHPPFLTPAWREYTPAPWYMADLAVNVVGFIPAGFFICASLISLRRGKRSIGIATLTGFLLSLSIEILQAYIPMRKSGTTDLITNTLGTLVGAFLCAHSFRYWNIFRKPAPLHRKNSTIDDR
jgi:VanZ family protein